MINVIQSYTRGMAHLSSMKYGSRDERESTRHSRLICYYPKIAQLRTLRKELRCYFELRRILKRGELLLEMTERDDARAGAILLA